MNTQWLNKTVNKSKRTGQKIEAIVWHETASPSSNAENTLNYNLSASAGSSYHYLIGRDGVIYYYLDPTQFIAWHTGKSKLLGYTNFQVNACSIGIELDGPNNGTPVTQQQLISANILYNQLITQFGPLISVSHKDIALPKGRKSDPKGFIVGLSLSSAE